MQGDLLRVERILLDALEFNVAGPTAYAFLHLLTQVRVVSGGGGRSCTYTYSSKGEGRGGGGAWCAVLPMRGGGGGGRGAVGPSDPVGCSGAQRGRTNSLRLPAPADSGGVA